MPKPAFERIEQLFHEVVDVPVERRAAFLDAACGDDPDLRAAVDELLRHDRASAETDRFLVSPLTQAVAALRPTQPAVPADPAAPHIPGYQILGSLGRGGMGVVYKARQISLKRIVALKMLLPTELAEPAQLARFKSEAELLARIHQPNIIPIYEIGDVNGRPYFTMAFVDGPNLAQYLAGRPQDPRGSAHLIEVLARAIQTVHEVGIIHRDLKPGNVLLQLPSGDGANRSSNKDLQSAEPKITDFGLAKDWLVRRDLTQSGVALGTPSYMAPEQAFNRPEEIGPATDIYSLGAILYEMMTGRPPFDAPTPAETIGLLLTETPLSPTRLRAGLPRDLTTICLKCLEKAPRRRYASARELADDLQRFQAGEPIRARPVGFIAAAWRWCRRHPLAAALAALCALLVMTILGTVLYYNHHLQAALTREHELTLKQRQQIVQLNINVAVTHYLSGDSFAALLHYAEAMRTDDPAEQASHRQRLAALLRECPRLIEVEETRRTIAYARPTAQGIFAAATTNDSLEFRDVLTNRKAAAAALDGRNLRSTSLCPDGRWAARVGHDGAVHIVDGGSAPARTLTHGEGPAIADVTIHRGADVLVSAHADGSKKLWVLTDGRYVARPLPASTHFAISDCGQWLLTVAADGSGELADVRGGPTKRPLRLGPGIDRALVSAQAERVVTIGQDQSVRVCHVPSSARTTIAHRGGRITHAQFSPDGKRLLLADADGTIRVWDAATARPITPLLRSAGSIAAVDFQGDGDHVVTVSRSGSVRVWELPGATPSQASRWDPQCDTRPVEELIAILQLMAHRRLDEQQHITTLADDYVRSNIERVNMSSGDPRAN